MMEDCGFSVFLWIIDEQDITILDLSKIIIKEAIYCYWDALNTVLLKPNQVPLFRAVLDTQSEHAC